MNWNLQRGQTAFGTPVNDFRATTGRIMDEDGDARLHVAR